VKYLKTSIPAIFQGKEWHKQMS